MVLSDRMVVVLYKHFGFWLSTFFNCQNYHELYAHCYDWILHYVICQQFVQLFQVGWLLLMSVQYCISPFFLSDCMKHCRFTCLCHFCNKITNAVKGGTTAAAWLYRQHNQSIHMTGGMTVMSLFATPPTLTRTAMDCVCHTALNWKVLHICNAKAHYNENYTKRNNIKHDLALLAIFSKSVWNRSYFVCLVMCNHLLYKIRCYLTTHLIVR